MRSKNRYEGWDRYSQRTEPEYSRRCHDCGRPTNDYRCPKCWARLRGSVEGMSDIDTEPYHSALTEK